MISEIYKNSELYYSFLKEFLHKKISAWEFRTRYWDQRDEDIDQNRINGYRDYYLDRILWGDEKIFEEKYADSLYEQGLKELKRYEEGARQLNINGELFFMGLWNYIDDYVREYYPSDDEAFDPKSDVDEKKLTKIIQAVFDVLERNKDRWMMEKQEFKENQSQEDHGQKI
jgi:hypothetical protein